MNRFRSYTLSMAIAMIATLIVASSASASGKATLPQPMQAATMSATMAATEPNSAKSIRDTRYCEVLPVNMKAGKLVASVYNTIGHSDCPDADWKALDVAAIKKQFNAVEVILNGPRYWAMDQIIAKGASQDGETVTIGTLVMTKRAEVVLKLADLKSTFYQERLIDRDTQYVFAAGKPTYRLTSPDGYTYVMQTYSQQIDPKLTVADLAALDTRLKLPPGWKYQVVTPEKELRLTANGVAHLIQDDLANSYQRIEPTDLGPSATQSATQQAPVATPAATTTSP
jgi:hypothetical protein